MFQDEENAVCGAFDEGEIDKQILMMTSNCTNLEQAQKKLSWALNLAKEATIENKTMREELDALLLEADRLKLQLEQKKTQLALVEEKKAENELNMKREIRSLLEAYLQVKSRLEELEPMAGQMMEDYDPTT